MRDKITILILYIMVITTLTGCFDAKELDELGISLIMGIDIEDGKVLLTAEVVDPQYTTDSAGAGQGSSVKYVQGVGNNLFEAFRDITLKFDCRIYAAHNKVLIFGEELAKKGIVTHIDELFRDREQRETAYMLIAKGSKAYEVMGISSGLETMPGYYVLDLINNVENNPKAIDINIINYLKYYHHEGHHPIAGVIEKKQKNDIDETSEKTGTQGYELSILGSAIFKKDNLVGYLNGNDTKSLNFLLDNVKGGIITFPAPSSSGEKVGSEEVHQNLSSVVIVRSKTKNDVEFKGDRLILKTKINIRASLGELAGKIDVSKEGNLRRIEEACSRTIEENIKAAVKKVQKEHGIDIFGFGIVFHRKYPKQWKKTKENWDEAFVNADFQIEVDTNIIRTGLVNRPIME